MHIDEGAATASSVLRDPRAMPYSKVSDLPKSQVDQYTLHQKRAFLEAFNNAFEEYDGDEHHAFAVAHAAAKRADDGHRPNGQREKKS